MGDAGVPVEEHLGRILGLVRPLPPVTVALGDALGLVLAEQVSAAEALPRFDHAAMDGYAVRAADVAGASPERPVVLPVVAVVAAGDADAPALEPGTALRIMTGAPVPEGADAVVPFEWTDGGSPVRVLREAVPGRHIRREGEDVAAGSVVLHGGTLLRGRHLGLLAAVGRPEVVVLPAPRVAVLATGAELVGADARLRDLPGQVADSNTVALAAAARAAGAAAVGTFGPVPDDSQVFLEQLEKAASEADLLVTTGGISAGDHDVVKAALSGREGFWFGSVALKPGRPQGCGVLTAPDGRVVPVITLPGTPVAAYSSFCLFVLPALRRLGGRAARAVRRLPLAAPVTAAPDRTSVLPAVIDPLAGTVAPVGRHPLGAPDRSDRTTSSDPGPGTGHSQRMLAAADALLVVPPQGRLLPAGTELEVIPLDPEDR